jgi:hypothetical protein
LAVPTVHQEQKHGVSGTLHSGYQELSFGVSGTPPFRMILIFTLNSPSLNPLTSLTQNIKLSNSKTVPDNPMEQPPTLMEAQAYRRLSLPMEGASLSQHPSITIPAKITPQLHELNLSIEKIARQ